MRIDAASLQLTSARVATREFSQQTSLRAWVGDRPPDRPEPPRASAVAISPAAQASLQADREAAAPDAAQAIDDAAQAVESDPRMRMLLSLIEMLTGRPARTLRMHDAGGSGETAPPAAPPQGSSPQTAAPRPGFGLALAQHTVYEETESTQFSAEGVVRTADGQQIRFQLSLSMQRSYREESSVSLQWGDVALQDPLVINFAGTAAQLQNQRFAFDLDADGTREDVPLLAPGSGFLALDLDANQRIDTGRELFGPATGNGFTELAQHDADGNGWIDEADPVFARLRVWTPTAQGTGALQSLAQAGVGAIALGHVATPFALRDAQNGSLGQVRASSVYLGERGGAGTVQQIDVSV